MELSIKFNSFSGGLSAFFLLQIFGFVLFQAILHYVDSIIHLRFDFFILISAFLVIGFIHFQSRVLENCIKFLQRTDIHAEIGEDLNKYYLSIVLFVVFILFVLGIYPFPSIQYDYFHLGLFYVISWNASFYAPKINYRFDIKSWVGRIFILAWGLFAIFWYWLVTLTQNVGDGAGFYTMPFWGLGLIVVVLVSILADYG